MDLKAILSHTFTFSFVALVVLLPFFVHADEICQDCDDIDEIFGYDIHSYNQEIMNFDPHENINRQLFAVHEEIANNIIIPSAKLYNSLPKGIRYLTTNFLNNLKEIRNILSAVLLLDPHVGHDAIIRFVFNSTLGLGGILNVTEKFGLQYQNTTIGYALSKNNVPSGNYIIVPGVGPSTYLHAFSHFSDLMIQPILFLFGGGTFLFVINYIDLMQTYSQNINNIKLLQNNKNVDSYDKWRNYYFQRMKNY